MELIVKIVNVIYFVYIWEIKFFFRGFVFLQYIVEILDYLIGFCIVLNLTDFFLVFFFSLLFKNLVEIMLNIIEFVYL